VTSNLLKRIWEHKNEIVEGFTKKYNIHMLVYYEQFENIYDAIEREKALKGTNRIKKKKLIESKNPEWKDLYESICE
jgi:putative endonuclease